MTVTAIDAAGSPVAGFRGTVYITSNDPAATSSIAYTFTAADAGLHAFAGSVRLVTEGDQTVTVAAPFMTSSNQTVTVTPRVSRFSVGNPTVTAAGSEFRVTVSALDRWGAWRRVTPVRSTSPARTCKPGCLPTTPSPPPTRASTPSPSS